VGVSNKKPQYIVFFLKFAVFAFLSNTYKKYFKKSYFQKEKIESSDLLFELIVATLFL